MSAIVTLWVEVLQRDHTAKRTQFVRFSTEQDFSTLLLTHPATQRSSHHALSGQVHKGWFVGTQFSVQAAMPACSRTHSALRRVNFADWTLHRKLGSAFTTSRGSRWWWKAFAPNQQKPTAGASSIPSRHAHRRRHSGVTMAFRAFLAKAVPQRGSLYG